MCRKTVGVSHARRCRCRVVRYKGKWESTACDAVVLRRSTSAATSTWASPGGTTAPGTPASEVPSSSFESGGTPSGARPALPPNVVVRLVPRDGAAGTIVEAFDGGAAYTIALDGGDMVKAEAAEVEVVRPAKRDEVHILSGEHRGLTGKLIGIDGTDGIVKLNDQAAEIKILDLESCAKLAE